jgi:hypothetical protein
MTETETVKHEKILDKLGKIKRMADGAKAIGSEAEAQAFADLLSKLLLDHKLEMTDLEFEKFEEEQPVGVHRIDYSLYPFIKVRSHRVVWIEQLARIVAESHFCRILIYPNSNRVALVGRHEDATIAEYMFVTLFRSIDTIEQIERRKWKHERPGLNRNTDGFRESFIQAFLMRLRDRFLDLRRARETESMALMRINKSDKAVQEFIEENYEKKARGISKSTRFHPEAVQRGRAAADKVNLKPYAMETGVGKKELS